MSLGAPNTIFAGTAGAKGDRPGPDKIIGRVFMYIVLGLLCPFGILAHAGWILTFTYARIRQWIPAAVFVVCVIITLFVWNGSVVGMISTYVSPWFEMFGHPDGFVAWLGQNWWKVFAAQLWLGFVIGTAYSAVAVPWKWYRRPKYEERAITVGPILKRRAKKTAEDIASNQEGPSSGMTLGVSLDTRDKRFAAGDPGTPFGERVVMQDDETAGHVFVTGGAGSGKTTTLLMNARDAIRLGRGVVFLDCKGGPDVPEMLAVWAQRYGRVFRHWNMSDSRLAYTGPAENRSSYDPLSRGDASRKKDLLVDAWQWDVEYYKTVVSHYLQTAFHVIHLVPPPKGVSSFQDVANMLDRDKLITRAKNIPREQYPELWQSLEQISNLENQAYSGVHNMHDRIYNLIASTAGEWMKIDPEGNNIDFRKVAYEGEVVCISLDTSNYESTSAQLAGLMVQDLKTVSSELRQQPTELPFHIFLDEFAAVEANNITGLLAKARDAKMCVELATQALADLTITNPAYLEQILGIVSSFIIHRPNSENDAQVLAGIIGKRMKTIQRVGVEHTSSIFGSLGAAANVGVGYLEEKDEYAVPVSAVQEIERGQCIYVAKSPFSKYVYPVQVVRENPNVNLHTLGDQGIPRTPQNYVHDAGDGFAEKVTYDYPESLSSRTTLPAAPPVNPVGPSGGSRGGKVNPKKRPKQSADIHLHDGEQPFWKGF